MAFQPRFMATHLAAVPQRDSKQVCRLILDHFPEAPCLPRLTRSTRMYLEGMPCLVIDSERGKLSFDLSPEREHELLEFYERVIADDVDYFAISEASAPGVYALVRALQQEPPPELKVVHIQTPGPVSWAMTAVDQNGAPAFYNETMRDIMVKTLAMKARWQEKMVREALPGVATLLDYGEPALVIHTSAVGSGARADLIKAINEVLDAVEGMAGVHCCANIDWSILLESHAEKGFSGKEEDYHFRCPVKLLPIAPRAQLVHVGPDLLAMPGKVGVPVFLRGGRSSVQKRLKRDLGIYRNAAAPWQIDNHVRTFPAPVACQSFLLGEIAVL